ncbi:hypothetical protein [Aquimarina sp. MMG016]|uniref:hypothetical protein n=1 Tax=Aquimarina sp. MMG016 TaxID=2822690 RepID=UPI001B3A4A61|nr:hypothetical protein [Aquimarina sp. MMG016]MBQ4819926.1 hypothetical protein [Aquimarina sp. MMG016]
MKVLGKILIIGLIFVNCKGEINQKTEVNTGKNSSELVEQKSSTKAKEKTVEDFLKEAIDIINTEDKNKIESILNFPFEGYTLGGGEVSYPDFESLIYSNEVYESFTNLKYAVKIEPGKDKEMYWVDIKAPNGYEVSNIYRIIEAEGEYKFKGMQLPF